MIRRRVLNVFIMVVFVHLAGFQTYIFYHLWKYQEITLWDDNLFFNRAELGTIIAILGVAIYLLYRALRDVIDGDR